VIGTGCKDYPVQVACTTHHNLPYTVATHKFSRKNIKFVSETGEQDPYINKILNDRALSQLPLQYTHIINKDERMDITYGMQVIPKSPFFYNKTLCTITSGTVRKTLNMYGRRMYQMDHYLSWLENIVRNLQELNYQGPTIKDTCYSSIYFILHPEITDLNATDATPAPPHVQAPAPAQAPAPTPSSGPKFCTKCGTPITQGFKFCKKCGEELPKVKGKKLKYCTFCGNQIPAENKFCTYCGNKKQK
jgi:predicted nucleic acid-binding Zn ribbon protein